MKKIYNYILFKFNSTKLAIIIIFILIYQFSLFFDFVLKNTQYNFYDLIMNNFEYLSLFYFINLFFMIMLYSLYEKKTFYTYLNLKFTNRQEVFKGNVIFAFLLSIFIVVFINCICILQSINKISFNNSWSLYFSNSIASQLNLSVSKESVNIIISKLTPLSYVIYNNLFVILYLFFISTFFIVCNIIFKKKAVSFILVVILNAVSMIMEVLGNKVKRLSFASNIFFITSSQNELNNGTYIISRIAYWILLIVSLYIIGNLLTKKLDCNYGE